MTVLPKMKISISFLISLLAVMNLSSCREVTQYSEIPEISFKRIFTTDTVDILGNQVKKVKLTFSVIDGDGDVGLRESDTIAPYINEFQYNFYSLLFGKTNGIFEKSELPDANYRIPYVEVEEGKSYKADIDVTFQYQIILIEFDSIRLDFFIYDRALNKSNIASTPVIIL
jgi:hypothetical protein